MVAQQSFSAPRYLYIVVHVQKGESGPCSALSTFLIPTQYAHSLAGNNIRSAASALQKKMDGGEWKQSFGDCKNVASSEKAAANKIDHCSPQPRAHIILMPLFAGALIFASGSQSTRTRRVKNLHNILKRELIFFILLEA